MSKNIRMFVLAGAWECPDDLGVSVVALSTSEEELIEKLGEIADSKAKDYVTIEGGILNEERTDTRYEISGELSGNARFYITEEMAKISDVVVGDISRARDNENKAEDVKYYLQGLYESGNLHEELYEELIEDERFLRRSVELIDKYESSNAAYNTTVELAVEDARKERSYE